MTIAEKLAELVCTLDFNNIPIKTVDELKTYMIDALGCMLVGSKEEHVRIVREICREEGGCGGSTVIGAGGMRLNPRSAAMVNSMAAHCYDYDDMNHGMKGQMSCVLLPAAIAVGEKYAISGERLFTAYYAGICVDYYVGRLLFANHYGKSWSTTSAIGIFGAVAAAGAASGLAKEELVNALCMAVDASGGFKINYGTSAKDLAVGQTAARAVELVEYARRGFKANREAFEGRKGLFSAVLPDNEEGRTLFSIPEIHREEIMDSIVLKPYPSSRGNHTALDCVLNIIMQNEVEAKHISHIRCFVQDNVKDVEHYPFPRTKREGRYSLRYCVASLIINGRIGLEDFADEDISDPEILELMRKIEILEDDSFFQGRYGTEVVIMMNNGEVYNQRYDYGVGSRERPMGSEEVYRKFNYNVKSALGEGRTTQIIECVRQLEQLSGIQMLTYLLI